MSKHGNSYENEEEHHLYDVHDLELDTTFKLGISADELEADGTSPRGNEQARYSNKVVGYYRFVSRVLISGIMGRRKARQIEDEHIENYKKQHGHYPRGNQDHKKYRG